MSIHGAVVLLLLAVAAPVLSADSRPRAPALVLRGEDAAALPLARLEVDTAIVGFLARTSLTMTFRNDHGRALEGELIFPLPEGATVAGYALDVDGQMVEGVVVEARAARVAFETEQRARVDPGLVEWVRGDNFRTRVWPIPAHGTRTVRVEYVSELVTAPDSTAGVYTLPLKYETAVREVEVRIEVLKGPAAPEVRGGALPSLRFAPFRHSFVAETTLRDAELRQDLLVVLPGLWRPSVAVEEYAGAWYFTIDDFPEMVAPPAPRSIRRVQILWDASLSRASAHTPRERAFLAFWLASLGNVDVDLTVFRNVAEPSRRFRIRGGDARALTSALEGVAYDGGTDLGALSLGSGKADVTLLFSDGLGTLGDRLPHPGPAPVYALGGGSLGDSTLLRHIAEASGGAYLNLAHLSDADAAAALARTTFSLVSVEAAGGAVTECLPAGRRPVTSRVTVTGRLTAPEAAVTLRYGYDGRAAMSRTFTVSRRDAAATGLVSRYWAQQKVAALSMEAERHHEALVALGREHGIVTPGTSLLVLETLEQHLRYGIEPPPGRATMREQYLAQIAEREAGRAEARKDKLERVAEAWARRVAWWRTDFRPTPRPKPTRTPAPVASMATPRPPAPVTPAPCGAGSSEVIGQVKDEQGATIPGTPVTLVHESTGAAVQVMSMADGRYRFCGVVAGRYTLKAELPGFRAFATRGLAVADRQRLGLDVVLSVGAMMESIEVMANSVPGQTISGDAIGELPLNGRNFLQLALLAPGVAPSETTATIAVRPWDPDTPYLRALAEARPGDAYEVYLKQRETFGTSPAFYLDCADFFYRRGQAALGLRILTGVIELKLDEPRLLRVAAHRLEQIGERDLAIALFEKVLKLRPEEPQSPRDLALALSARADAHRKARRRAVEIAADYHRALALLNDVVLGEWDRFDGIEVIALTEANRIIAVMEREGLPGRDTIPIDGRLRHRLDLDLRIVLTWDSDRTDMDLWVTEPSGETCDYSRSLTAWGGAMSRDFTEGYGPEEYVARRAQSGRYRIEASYYGSREVSFTGPTTVQATVITNFGRSNEKREALTLRLTGARDVVEIGQAEFARRRVSRAPAP